MLAVALSLLAPASALARHRQPAAITPGVAVNSTAPAAGKVKRTNNGVRVSPTGLAGTSAGRTKATNTGSTTTLVKGSATTPAAGATGTPAPGATTTAPPTTTTVPVTTTPTQPATSTAPAAKKKAGGRHISTGVAIIAVLAALLVLGAAAWALARRFAYEPTWWLGTRHSFSEASFRTSATWAEFRDWARIGR